MIKNTKMNLAKCFESVCVFLVVIPSISGNFTVGRFPYESFFKGGLLKQIGGHLKNNHDFIKASICTEDLLLWTSSLNETWAIQMLDSGGGIPSGIMRGNLFSYGQFDECLAIRHPLKDRTIKGQYCLASIPISSKKYSRSQRFLLQNLPRIMDLNAGGRSAIPNIGFDFQIALCMPSSCRPGEVEAILNGLVAASGLGLQKISLPPQTCSTDDSPQWYAGDYVAIVYLSFFGALVVLSTLHDVWYDLCKQEKPKYPVLNAFSAYTNTGRLFSVSPKPGRLACLHGIRVLSLTWVVLGHRYSVSLPFMNMQDAFEWMLTYSGMVIVAAGISVDSFFLLSGILLSYVLFKKIGDKKYFNPLMFYLHRFLRLTPALAVIVLLEATVLRYIGTGPSWNYYNNVLADTCQRKWWATLLYIQNYVSLKASCVGQAWYLAVDTQLFVLSPILIFPILYRPKLGMIFTGLVTVGSQILVFVICYQNAWYASPISTDPHTLATRDLESYFVTHMRATPWLIGFIAGYYLNKYEKKNIKFNKWIIILGWMTSLAIFGAVILGLKPLIAFDHKFSYAEDTMYLAFSRTGWSIALLWVVVASAHGHGGPVNWFLSFRIWEVLGRFSYAVYLIHMHMQLMMIFSRRIIPVFAHVDLVYQFLGDLCFSLFFAYFLVITFESPVTILEKWIFAPKKTPLQKIEFEQDPNTNEIKASL